jgi:hypothetical protein
MYENAIMMPVVTVPGRGEGKTKDNDGGGEFKYDIFDTLLRTFVNATM